MVNTRTILDEVDDAFADGKPAVWMPGRQLFIGDAQACRDILWNKAGLYKETSDFFSTKWGTLSPRSSQVRMGLAAKVMLDDILQQVDIPKYIAALNEKTAWPRTGCAICYGLFEPMLFSQSRSREFKRLVLKVIENRIYSTQSRSLPILRARLRDRIHRVFVKELCANRARGNPAPTDLFDVVAANIDHDTPPEQAAQIYISFVFSLLGSIGFTFGWAIYLAVEHNAFDLNTEDIISESLRLYPIAWMMQRSPVSNHTVLGELVSKDDLVTVSPFAMHRSPRNWEDARCFKPQRWRKKTDRKAWLPFGAGPHMCVGVTATFTVLNQALAELFKTRRLSIRCDNPTPDIGPALKPPNFTLIAKRL